MAILQQRGLTRFAFCLFLWFVCTKCDFDWVFSFVDDFIPPEQLEVSDNRPVPPPSENEFNPATNKQQQGKLKILKKIYTYFLIF